MNLEWMVDTGNLSYEGNNFCYGIWGTRVREEFGTSIDILCVCFIAGSENQIKQWLKVYGHLHVGALTSQK